MKVGVGSDLKNLIEIASKPDKLMAEEWPWSEKDDYWDRCNKEAQDLFPELQIPPSR